jgi:hypothetical protein
MFVLYLITSLAFGLILGYLIGSYLVLIPVILNVLVLFYFGKISATKFTERMVEGWFKWPVKKVFNDFRTSKKNSF